MYIKYVAIEITIMVIVLNVMVLIVTVLKEVVIFIQALEIHLILSTQTFYNGFYLSCLHLVENSRLNLDKNNSCDIVIFRKLQTLHLTFQMY